MPKSFEVRWHGRGGQGAKTAATFLAEASLLEGKFSQGFPEYGPERMGAPVRGFTRISDEPILAHYPIEAPDVVVVLDDTLLDIGGITDGLGEKGVLIVNTVRSPEEIRQQTGFTGLVGVVDATKISIEEIGRPIPNTPMIGALLKLTSPIKMDTAYTDIRHKFERKFPEKVIQGNLNAIKRAHEEVKT